MGPVESGRGPDPGARKQPAVASAIAELPGLQQEAVILFEYEGVTLEELAQIVAADVGTVHALEAEQSRLDPSKLIFIETGTSINMTNVTMRGCCPRGNPL